MKFKSRKVFLISVFLITAISLLISITGCQPRNVNETTEQKHKEQVNENINEMQRQLGNPKIDDFFEYRMMKEIYELRDNSELICHAYRKNRKGQLIYIGKTLGYGLPYSMQMTSPEKIVDERNIDRGDGFEYGNGYGDAIMPQPEPNGLYIPEGLSATWLIMVDDKGNRKPAYYEPSIIVTQEKRPKRLCAEWSLPKDY